MDCLSPEQNNASEDFVSAAHDFVKSAPHTDPEVLILSAARLAGAFLFRSFDLDVAGKKPGDPIVADAVSICGPRLVQILGASLAALGVVLDNPKPQVALTPPKKMPAFLESQRRLGPVLAPIASKHSLSYARAAEALSAAIAVLIHNFVGQICPSRAFVLALQGFIEGASIIPDPDALILGGGC